MVAGGSGAAAPAAGGAGSGAGAPAAGGGKPPMDEAAKAAQGDDRTGEYEDEGTGEEEEAGTEAAAADLKRTWQGS